MYLCKAAIVGSSHKTPIRFGGVLFAIALAIIPSPAHTDACASNIWDNGKVRSGFVFPNWVRVWAGSFDVYLTITAGTENIRAITVVNFGTATDTDLKAVYWQAECGGTNTGLQTMTWVGIRTVDSGSYPGWTWTGNSIDLSGCPEYCVGCAGSFTINIYVDISGCPAPQSTVQMGFPVKSGGPWLGSIYDSQGCVVPWGDASAPPHNIVYANKTGDPEIAAPGDLVNYTIYYGRPGDSPLSSVVVMDTQPPYTHYVGESAVPNLDTGWDPDFGPPARLRWSIPPPHPVAGGPTGLVTFSLSVDWGNTEAFEPGSGDIGAPEGERLNNSAQVFFNGITNCARTSGINPPVTTVVRRFLFWKLADNDIMFSPTYGQPPDEIIYSIFVKNRSSTKTWWNVRIWDTVPPLLDAWCADCGFEDPCTGWTMTPTGCASAGPGRAFSGANTILTWTLDMPPGLTMSLRWKAKLKGTAPANDTVVNTMAIMELGRSGAAEGTGHSGKPSNFSHVAPVVLPTMYVSYVSYGASSVGDGVYCGLYIAFFPLNKKTQFELRGLQYMGVGWPTTGGVSGSIGALIGDCLNGFSGGGISGCRAERAPALYKPSVYQTSCPTLPFHFIYKLTSNSPILWQLMVTEYKTNNDSKTYAPATTFSYSGLMHYFWRRWGAQDSIDNEFGDHMGLINTSADIGGTYNPDLRTTVHMFKWDFGTLSWNYMRTHELDKESLKYDMGTNSWLEGPWKTVSSDARLIVDQGVNIEDNFGAFMPTRETGNVVSQVGSGNFYGIVLGNAHPLKVVVGNTGVADATYRVWRYVPYNTVAVPRMPSQLNGTSGYWVATAQSMVPAGQAAAGNARLYDSYGSAFSSPASKFESSMALFKVELVSGGPIQVYGGATIYSCYAGGAVFHASNGNQTGLEFWLHHGGYNDDGGTAACDPTTLYIDVFCPKTGMAIQCTSEDGYTATYTTTGPDQCVSFTKLTKPAPKRNYVLTVLPNPFQGNAVAQFIQCVATEKGYTAPFLSTGTHYVILAPPVVFIGQSFWITVVVIDPGGTTKTDYNGVTSFTSSDTFANIEGMNMSGYDYTWVGFGTENGVRIFFNVSIGTLGLQTIVGQDTQDGAINGLTTVMVVAADVKLSKEPKYAIASSGEQIQFRVCWSNYSSATAANFVITDAVPMGTSYVPEAASLMFCGAGGPALPGVTVAYFGASESTPATFNTLTSPTQTAPSNTRWLRWTIQDVYVSSTGCVCFRVAIN